MVDTIRTETQILALLADNITGDISPQDMRDIIVSLSVGGSMYVEDAAVTQVVGTSFELMVLLDANGRSDGVTPDHTADSLTIDANADGEYVTHFDCTFSGTGSTEFDFHIRKNGLEVNGAGASKRKLGTGGDVGSMSMAGDLTLAEGDTVTVWIKADGSSKDFILSDGRLSIKRIK